MRVSGCASLILSTSAVGIESQLITSSTAAERIAGDTRVRLAQNEAAPSLRRVSYSEDQADRGRRAYTRYCVLCHGDNLDDGEFGGTPLRGPQFEQTFGGEPASVFFLYISTLSHKRTEVHLFAWRGRTPPGQMVGAAG